MDKQKLRALPAQPAPAWMTKEASGAKLRRNDIELWYADVKQEADIIILRIYERSKLIGGIAHQENIRVYLDVESREYISQNMDLAPSKSWRTGRLDSVLSSSDRWGWPSFEWETGYVKKGYSPYLSFDKAGEDALERALGPLEDEETWGLRIYRWQDKILKERLLRRHDKELEPVVELMKQVPELPETFAEWLCTDGIARFDYVIYDPPKGRKQTRIQCTRCGAKMMVDVKKIHPVRDKRGTCPACGRPITWKTVTSKLDRGSTYYHWDEPWYVAIIQRMSKGLIVRYFFADVTFVLDHGEVKGRKCEWGEVRREILQDGDGTFPDCYERIRYKNQGKVRWAPANGEYRTHDAFLYTDNLPDVLRGTAWQYSGLKELQQKSWPHRIPLLGYMEDYPRKPFLEYFSKMGLCRLVRESLWYGSERNFDIHSTKPDQLLKIPKQDIKTLIKLDGGLTMLEVMQDAYLSRLRLSEEELVHYVSLFGSSPTHLLTIFDGDTELDAHRLLKYFRKQAEKAFDRSKWNKRYTKAEAMLALERNLCEDWHDYLDWLEEYMPECLTDLYYLLPPDLPKAHDRLMKIALERKEKEEAERRRKQEEAVNRFLEEMKETGGIGMQARGLMIRLPKDAGEIRREGELQHHCVATYIDRVERHETLILFVRKIEDPDTPFYTMEWKNGKVAQCRGMRNAYMTPEVKAFVGAFERKMQQKDQEAVRQKVRVTA